MSTPIRAVDDDPVLGRYLVHYTTDRLRLMLQAGVIYALSALVINVATFSLEGTLVNVVVPLLYTLVALPLIWAAAHLWNREVILFERGFTYRQGSVVAAFPYINIVQMHISLQRVLYFGIVPYERAVGILESDQGDRMRIDNVFKDARKLLQALERTITKARLPLVNQQIARGDSVAFGALTLTGTGITDTANRTLPWAAFTRVALDGDGLQIISGSESWGRYIEADLHSAAVLVAVLKERSAL